MIGNDIIDLALARTESNWKRKGFLEKIFTDKEQILILNSENPEITIWSLWSRKEAVYKIYNRKTKIRGYIPLQLECFECINDIGKVTCFGENYYTRTKITTDYIQTIAVVNIVDFNQISVLNTTFGIIKNDGIPSMAENNNPVSISHHGRFQQIITFK